MPEDKFRLPDASYELLCRVVMAYGHFDHPASLGQVSQSSAIHETTISRNTGFLVATGVLEDGKSKILTFPGRNLARALDHEIPSEISRSWRELVEASDFLKKILAAIRIRRGMERSALQAHISYSAGQAKTANTATGSNTIIDILVVAGLIADEDGKLVVIQRQTEERTLEGPTDSGDSLDKVSIMGGDTDYFASSPRVVSVVVQLNVACALDQIASAGVEIRRLIDSLSDVGASVVVTTESVENDSSDNS